MDGITWRNKMLNRLTLCVTALLIGLCLTPLVSAQTLNLFLGSFQPYAGLPHTNGQRIVGSNTFAILTPTAGASWAPTATGSCGFPYPTVCNGVRVLFIMPTGNQLCQLVETENSATSRHITFITPELPYEYNGYGILIQKYDPQLGWIANNYRFDISMVDKVINPWTQSSTARLIGTLYGYDGTLLKSLTDGNPNPTTWNGQPTIVQAYFTGVKRGVSTCILYEINNPSSGFVTVNGCLTEGNFATYGPGVFTVNLVAPPGGWPVTVGSFEPTIFLSYDGIQPVVFGGKVNFYNP
jgi:hypothetical protein